jgi:hypothetical protein
MNRAKMRLASMGGIALMSLALVFGTRLAWAADDEIVGTYKLISSTRKMLDTGEVVDSFGKHPSGSIMYNRDGRFLVLITYDGRPKPASLEKLSNDQRAELFRTMLAYGGTYTFSAGKVEHHIDVSWNEIWTGTTVIRDIAKEGDRLVFTSRPAPFSGDGKMSITTLIWDKMM